MKDKPKINGEPVILNKLKGGLYAEEFACCDCGLTHLILYRIKKGKLICYNYRDDYKTLIGRARRRKRGK